jgi:phosphatidylserine/phosphatidylglycerophosphate/cardiolipin synthase-like enzyme
MRVRDQNEGLTAQAIAGNHVVILGWDMQEANLLAAAVLGFAIERHRYSDGETIWLSGMKTFEAVDPHPDPGAPVSSYRHPIQSFQWSDFSVEPGGRYRYRVVARCGQPNALVDGPSVTLDVQTEQVDQGRHSVFFNRGAIASQEYARRFQNRAPDKVGPAAYEWLSRGLLEGLEAFIDQAQNGDALNGSFYEFQNQRIFDRLRAARARGADVVMLFDDNDQAVANERALDASGIKGLTRGRKNSTGYAHNKFVVFSRAGVAEQVWTGSTNLTENGIFGHSNNAHIVRDREVSESYLSYWKTLRRDTPTKTYRTIVDGLGPIPAPPSPNGDTVTVFSPRSSADALQWYADIASSAEGMLGMTFAFGMNALFVPVYDRTDNVLRFALMEKKGNNAAQVATTERVRKRPNTTIAVGAFIPINAFDRWLTEIDREDDPNIHVRYIHTKYMLVDPLGDAPIVVIGSANFSKASSDTNDENMLVIRGNRALADIYLGEFMRLFAHYAFRESLKFSGATTAASALSRKFLIASPDWIHGSANAPGYFKPGTDRFLRRLYFS